VASIQGFELIFDEQYLSNLYPEMASLDWYPSLTHYTAHLLPHCVAPSAEYAAYLASLPAQEGGCPLEKWKQHPSGDFLRHYWKPYLNESESKDVLGKKQKLLHTNLLTISQQDAGSFYNLIFSEDRTIQRFALHITETMEHSHVSPTIMHQLKNFLQEHCKKTDKHSIAITNSAVKFYAHQCANMLIGREELWSFFGILGHQEANDLFRISAVKQFHKCYLEEDCQWNIDPYQALERWLIEVTPEICTNICHQ
jgi:hypothetical protein